MPAYTSLSSALLALCSTASITPELAIFSAYVKSTTTSKLPDCQPSQTRCAWLAAARNMDTATVFDGV
jgi:hypothetical protein